MLKASEGKLLKQDWVTTSHSKILPSLPRLTKSPGQPAAAAKSTTEPAAA